MSWSTSTSTPIYELLEHPSCRSNVAGSPRHRARAGFPRGGSGRIQYWQCRRSQRPRNRPMTHCNEHLPVETFELKGALYDSLWHTSASTVRLLLVHFCLFSFLCFSFCRGRMQEQRVDTKWGEISGIEVHIVKPTNNPKSPKTNPVLFRKGLTP